MPRFRKRKIQGRYRVRLLDKMLELGFKRKALMAKHLRLSPHEFSRYSKGRVMPSMETLCMIAERLGCKLDELIERAPKGEREQR